MRGPAELATTNAEVIASRLNQAGIEYAFGLPGGEIVVLIDALRKAGLRVYLTGHEASAAFMAEITGQLTGRPGVCVSTLGPGAVNLSLGLADARLDRGPVLAITGQVSTSIARNLPHQRLPLEGIFGQICKASVSVDGNDTGDLVDWCLHEALAPPPGPVHLALPSNLASDPTTPGSLSFRRTSGRVPTVPPDHQVALESIRKELHETKRPLIMVGVGCLPRDVPALRHFIEATTIPFVVTPKAKGILREDDSGFLGVISGMAVDRTILQTIEAADLLVGIGFDPVELDKPWHVGKRIVNLSRYSTAEGDYDPLESLGDIGNTLQQLSQGLAPRPWPPQLVAERRKAANPGPLHAQGGLSPLRVVRALRDVIPPEGVITCDVGSHKYFMGQFWRSFHPQTFFMSNGLSAMGYALPAAIAAKLHFPDRPVVSVVGDGGMLMMLHNLVFLRQYGLPIVVICLVDGSLSLIRVAQERRGIEPIAVDFPPPDFVRIAKGFGLRAASARTLDALRRSVEGAVKGRVPTLVQVPVDIREYRAYC